MNGKGGTRESASFSYFMCYFKYKPTNNRYILCNFAYYYNIGYE